MLVDHRVVLLRQGRLVAVRVPEVASQAVGHGLPTERSADIFPRLGQPGSASAGVPSPSRCVGGPPALSGKKLIEYNMHLQYSAIYYFSCCIYQRKICAYVWLHRAPRLAAQFVSADCNPL